MSEGQPAQGRSGPWIAAGVGAALLLGGCCLFAVLLVGLGAAAGDAIPAPDAPPAGGPAAPTSPGAASRYITVPDVERSAPGFAPEALPGRWGEGSGQAHQTFLRQEGDQLLYQETGDSGSATLWRFEDGGRYQLDYYYAARGAVMRGQVVGRELGTWSLSGAALRVVPGSLRCVYRDLGRGTQSVNEALPAPRDYQAAAAVVRGLEVSLGMSQDAARNEALVLEGPVPDWMIESSTSARRQYVLQRVE